ncbi:hypothetical protein EMIT0P4_470008 [Pseudomonas sp. IT-P4]
MLTPCECLHGNEFISNMVRRTGSFAVYKRALFRPERGTTGLWRGERFFSKNGPICSTSQKTIKKELFNQKGRTNPYMLCLSCAPKTANR